MALKPITINNFSGGLNLATSSEIGDNQLQIAKNVFYNNQGQLQTRYGIKNFGNAVGSNKPVTSYFFYQRDDDLTTLAICASGTDMYKYDEVTSNWASIKGSLTEFETATGKTTYRTRRDYAVYKNIVYMGNGINAYASYDKTGTGTWTDYALQPKYRYLDMTTDRLFGCGEDSNPITVYYTAAAPANGSVLDANAVVVGGDETGKINGMTVLGNIILVMKGEKVYSVDVTNTRADAIDSQSGGFSDRSIANVDNSLVYLSDRGIDMLKNRDGVSGASALAGESIDNDVRNLTAKIKEFNLNSNCGWYIKGLNNYYFSFDTNNDDVPDTTLVYNAMVKAWTQYSYPNLYDYGRYIDKDGVNKFVATSAITDQIYQIEEGFTDLDADIEVEIKSKDFDFGEPGVFKTFDYIDLIGKKCRYKDIDLTVEVDGVVVQGGKITDANIIETKVKETLGTRPVGVDTLTGSKGGEGLDVYQYVVRIPMYATGNTVNFGLKSTGCTWILDKARMGVNKQPIDVFGFNNII